MLAKYRHKVNPVSHNLFELTVTTLFYNPRKVKSIMTYSNIEVTTENNITVIKVSREAAYNALNKDTYPNLFAIVDQKLGGQISEGGNCVVLKLPSPSILIHRTFTSPSLLILLPFT